MANWETISRKVVLPFSAVVATLLLVLFCYSWWDIIATDAVKKPLLAENLGIGLFSNLMVFVALCLKFSRRSPHTVLEASVGAGAVCLVSSCRTLSLVQSSESSEMVVLIGIVGLIASVCVAVQAVLTLWENADSLRVLPFQAGDAADDGDCGDEMNGGGEVAPELGPPDSDDNGAMAIDSAPPPYSASPSNVSLSVTCDLQPLLVADD